MITDTPGLVKINGVIVNTNNDSRSAYLKQRSILQSKDAEINSLQSQINNVSDELSQIKTLLLELLNKGT